MNWLKFADLARRYAGYTAAVDRSNDNLGWNPLEAVHAARFLNECSLHGIELTDGQKRFVRERLTMNDSEGGAK